MRCKKNSVGQLVCGMAVGAIALAPMAVRAADTTTTDTTTTTTTTTMMPAEPTMATGSVVRYYVDRSGFVTAMDIQTADGVQMVHFAPNMGQRLYSTYPVGGNISVWVTPSGMGTGHWNAVGLGATRPTSFMDPYTVSAVDVLEAEPYILTGAKMVEVKGKLSSMIVNNMGEVLGLVLDNQTVVRVPRELRQIAPGYAGSDRITPLFKGAMVSALGYPEAPRYGVLSPYGSRLIASAITVNGRGVGALGVPMMSNEQVKALSKTDIGGATMSNEELAAMGMGYQVYNPSGAMSGTGEGATMAPNTGAG